jgi:hypothetical protein
MRSGLWTAGVLVWLAVSACDSGGSDAEATNGSRQDAGKPKDDSKDAGMVLENDSGDLPDSGETDASARADGGPPTLPPPVELGVRQAQPTHVAVDATNIYWTAGSYVWTVSLAGGAKPEALAWDQEGPSAIVVSGGTLYWINAKSNEVMSLPVTGGTPVSFADVETSRRLQELAVSATHVYVTWARWDSNNVASGGVDRVPVAGGTPETIVNEDGAPRGIALDSTHAYWAVRGATYSVSADLVTTYAPGSIRRIAFTGSKPEVLAFDQIQPHSVALDREFVYWTNEVGGTVMKVPLAGGIPLAIADRQDHAWGIQVDAMHAYWTIYGGQVLRAPLVGGAPELIADLSPLNTRGIALDNANVYVAAFKSSTIPDGKVVRVGK